MRLVARDGGFNNAVKILSPRPLWYPACRYYSHSSTLQQIPRPAEPPAPGAYIPRPEPNPKAKEVAVLGGGITGLATAFNLAKSLPDAKITIYEAKNVLGGWIDTEKVEVDGGEIHFEWGPRTLRTDLNGSGRATLELIVQLGGDLADSIRAIGHLTPAATNRYIYYPDHLVKMPGTNPKAGMLSNIISNLYTMLTEPIFAGLFSKLIAEPVVQPRSSSVTDESVGDFLTRRFGTVLANNLVSAIFHGIYAGNIYKLSARTLVPSLWYLETRDPDGNGIVGESAELFFRGHSLRSSSSLRVQLRAATRPEPLFKSGDSVLASMASSSVYTFTAGLGQFITRLKQVLKELGNVKLNTSARVESINYDANTKRMAIRAGVSHANTEYDYVVSTLSTQELSGIVAAGNNDLAQDHLVKDLSAGPSAVDVMVVNLYYQNPDIVPVSGFGYLIPQSIPLEQNPERALGVIFASETSGPRGEACVGPYPNYQEDKAFIDHSLRVYEGHKRNWGEDDIRTKDYKSKLDDLQRSVEEAASRIIRHGQDTAGGTKITVMLGGHWWDGWQTSDLPSENEAIEMAKSVLARHLKIFEQPMVAKARMQLKCIPQYPVGYQEQMARIHTGLMKEFKGQLKVAGPWWQGAVGVNDCCQKALETALAIREGWDHCTGLEDYGKPETWYIVDNRTKTCYLDPFSKGR